MFSRLKPILTAIAFFGFVMPPTSGLAIEYSYVITQERRIERGSRIVIRNEFGDIRIAGSDRNTVEVVATGSQVVPVSITEGAFGNKRVFTITPVESGRGVRQNINLEIKVPRYVEFEPIYIRRGNISVIDLDGGVSVRTDEGNISVQRAGSVGGGLVETMVWSGSIDLSNINGDVRIIGISSNITVWLEYFRRVHADAACLSAGGCVAYYPTKVPFHYRSAWMDKTDPFGDLLAGCRKLGMVVIARTDPHATHQDVYDNHPDWIAVDAEGRPRRHWADPEFWATCALGPYNFEFMTQVHREIMTLYKADGIFGNRWSGSGMCYCEHCRSNFKAAYGMDLPRTDDPQDPRRRDYVLWRQQRLFELWRLWDSDIRKINPEARFIPNTGGGALSDLDMKAVGELADTLFADRQARRGLMPPWANGKNGKEYRAALGRKPVVGIFSVGLEEPYRWKDSVQSEAEIRIWVADGIANGLRPWFTKFAGTLHDRRWLNVVEDIYGWSYRSEPYLRNEGPLARVAMVYSQRTATFYGGEHARPKVEDHVLGFYHALIEARIPFEMVHDRLLDPSHIDRFKVLILPNIAALSDEQCNQLRQYLQRGGSIVATFETSLYDEWGVRKNDFGLADIFGVHYKGRIEGPMQNSYLTVENKQTDTGKPHLILSGLENAERIINGVYRLDVEPIQKVSNPLLTLIPSYPDLPMEEVFPRVSHTDIPGLYLQESGKSRVVYFPWDIDRTFWEVMCVDHAKLLRNAVEWAANEEKSVAVKGPGVLDVTAWRQRTSMTVHMVNLTNPMMMKGPFREVIPVGEQWVRVRLPEGRKAKRVQLLVSGQEPRTREAGDSIEVTVPSIGVHEVVAIDL